jgi:hypothetical protein
MADIDLKKELKQFYNASSKAPSIVDVPLQNYIMIDGMGDPVTAPSYMEAMQALYSVSYAVKFMVKRGPIAVDYKVMPAEGLWWMDDMTMFSLENKNVWKWTMMIMQSAQYVTKELFAQAVEQIAKKKKLPGLQKLRFENFHEGLSAQILHLGPYTSEGPTVQLLHNYIKDSGYKLRGKHHEIYFSDPERTAPEKLKTIIRQPIE